MNKWRIHYDDGLIHSNNDGPIEYHHGVICIVQINGRNEREIQQRRDYYILTDVWIPCDVFGVLDHTMHKLNEIKAVVAGRTVSNPEFERIYREAKLTPL